MNRLLLLCLVSGFFATYLFGCTQTAVVTSQQSKRVVTVTPTAVAKFQDFLRDSPGDHIRLSIESHDNGGFSYHLNIESPPIASDDLVDRSNGFTLVISTGDSLYVEGTTIDWKILPDGAAGFDFDNPGAIK